MEVEHIDKVPEYTGYRIMKVECIDKVPEYRGYCIVEVESIGEVPYLLIMKFQVLYTSCYNCSLPACCHQETKVTEL